MVWQRWFVVALAAFCIGAKPFQSHSEHQSSPGAPVMDDPLSRKPNQAEPPLHTVGVQGSIDSGGYSAPAAEKARSALTSDMLRFQLRALKATYSVKTTLSCDMERPLIDAANAYSKDSAAKYRVGEFYLQHGDPANAVLYLQRAHDLNPADGNVARLLAIADLETQKPANVLDLVLEGTRSYQNAELWDLAGLAAKELGKPETAEEQFRLAADHEPSEENTFAWGAEQLLLGRPERAAEIFGHALAQHPQSVMLATGMGAALYSQGRVPEAQEMLLRAAEMDPSAAEPCSLLARILDSSNGEMPPDLGTRLNALIARAPNNRWSHFAYALCLWKSKGASLDGKQGQEIENQLKHAIAIDPVLAEAHFKLASLYAERGQYALAIPEYVKTTQTDPTLVEAHYRLGQSYMHTGQVQMAKQELALHQRLRAAQTHESDNASEAINQALLSPSTPGIRSTHCPVSVP